MKPKTMILMVVAVACGLGASYMTSRLLAERKDAPQVVERPKTKVLVAKSRVDLGTPLKNPQALFIEKEIDKEAAPGGVLTDLNQLKDCRIKRLLHPGDFVHPDDLIAKDQVALEYN